VFLLRTPGYVAAGAGAAAAGLFLIACFNNPFLYAQVNVPAFVIIGSGLGVALGRREGRVGEPSSSITPATKDASP
jgi:hypothetical protein